MSRPWMPLYVGDYIADTGHLSCAESGAYLHLLMHYWMKGGLPDDDKQLSRIAKMTPKEWTAARPIIQAFFIDGWKHKRIEFELTEAARISAAGKAGGKASGEARRAKKNTNDPPTIDERSLNDQGNDPPTKCEALQPPPPSPREVSNISLGKKNGWSPPKHGAFHRQKGLVYVREGTPEWEPHSQDFESVHGVRPSPDKGGGYWFKMKGEAAA
jgi:uncharacterized protein YdaU (DUF1376 family)